MTRRWVGAGLAAAVLVSLATILWLLQTAPQNRFGAVTVVYSADQETAGNGLELAKLTIVDKGMALAGQGGGVITFLVGSGNQAHVVASVDAAVQGPDGAAESDDFTRRRVVTERIDQAITTTLRTSTTTPGRSLLAEQVMVASLAPPAGASFDIIYVGFGLSDQDPVDHRKQITGMDPSQSVASIADQLRPTPNAKYTLVFTAAAGTQEPLNTTTSSWRKKWWQEMTASTGATIEAIDERNIPAAPVPGSPTAEPIPNIPETTVPGVVIQPSPAQPPAVVDPIQPPPAPPAEPAAVPVVLAGSLFQPDSPDWIDGDNARAQLQPLVDAWNAYPGRYQPLTCIGRTAAIGAADTARVLSELRSAEALNLAGSMGIEIAAPQGAGYDDPLPGYPPQAPEQRSVICRLIPITK